MPTPPSAPTDSARPILAAQLSGPWYPSQLRFDAVNRYAPRIRLTNWNGMKA
jgi:hypothetical protein